MPKVGGLSNMHFLRGDCGRELKEGARRTRGKRKGRGERKRLLRLGAALIIDFELLLLFESGAGVDGFA